MHIFRHQSILYYERFKKFIFFCQIKSIVSRQTDDVPLVHSIQQGRSLSVDSIVHNSNASTLRQKFCVAFDCPFGVDFDSGAVQPFAMKYDMTIAVGSIGTGVLTSPGAAELCGELVVMDNEKFVVDEKTQLQELQVRINTKPSSSKTNTAPSSSSSSFTQSSAILLTMSFMRSLLPSRPRNGHKGFSKVCFCLCFRFVLTQNAYDEMKVRLERRWCAQARWRTGARRHLVRAVHCVLASAFARSLCLLRFDRRSLLN